MAKGILQKTILIIGICLTISMPAYAKENETGATTAEQEQTEQSVEIAEEEVPLGLKSYADFEGKKALVFGETAKAAFEKQQVSFDKVDASFVICMAFGTMHSVA